MDLSIRQLPKYVYALIIYLCSFGKDLWGVGKTNNLRSENRTDIIVENCRLPSERCTYFYMTAIFKHLQFDQNPLVFMEHGLYLLNLKKNCLYCRNILSLSLTKSVF